MSDYQGWTLEQHEEVNLFNIRDHKLGGIIMGMQQTSYHKWGFTIYRCTYSDEEAWLRYIQQIKDEAIRYLEYIGQKFLLEKYLDFSVVEDRELLDGASKSVVRTIFAERAERDRQRHHGGPGTETQVAKLIPRFNYCMYVDQLCLDTLLAREQWERESGQGRQQQQQQQQQALPPLVVSVLVDTDCEPDGEGQDGYEAIEGCTRWFPGWMYCLIEDLVDIYHRLHSEELTDGYQTYERPPGVPNSMGMRMPQI